MTDDTYTIDSLTKEIKYHLKNITQVTDQTLHDDSQLIEIGYLKNPLNPNLLAYCFDVILGFHVQYKIFEKVNYVTFHVLYLLLAQHNTTILSESPAFFNIKRRSDEIISSLRLWVIFCFPFSL